MLKTLVCRAQNNNIYITSNYLYRILVYHNSFCQTSLNSAYTLIFPARFKTARVNYRRRGYSGKIDTCQGRKCFSSATNHKESIENEGGLTLEKQEKENSKTTVELFLDDLLGKKCPEIPKKNSKELTLHDFCLLGIIPPISEINELIRTFVKNNQVDEVIKAIELTEKLRVSLEVSFYQDLIIGFFHKSNNLAVFKLLGFLSDRDVKLGFTVSNWLFRTSVNNGEVDFSKECFSFLFYRSFLRKNETFFGFLRYLEIENQTILHNCLNPQQLRLLFGSFSKRESIDEILSLLSLIFKMGLNLDTKCYEIFLDPLTRFSPEMAMKLYEHIKLSPNPALTDRIYLKLARGLLRRHNQLSTAQALIDEMPNDIKTPRVKLVFANNVLESYFRYKTFEHGLKFYQHILDNYEPDSYTFTILFQRFNHYGKFEVDPQFRPRLNKLRHDVSLYLKKPDTILYNLMIKCFLKVDYEIAIEILKERESAGYKPDRYLYSMFIMHTANIKEDISLTLYWLERMVNEGFTPISEIVSAVLTLVKKNQDIPGILQVQNMLHRSDFKPNLDDHVERYIQNIKDGVPYVHIRKAKVRIQKVVFN